MKVLVLLALVALANARSIEQNPLTHPLNTYGINANYLIPLGEKIRAYEEANLNSRIAGGSPSELGQFPYQAGVLTNFIGLQGTGVCGGSLVSPNRVIYAAHCWFDGQNQGSQATIVLGSTSLFNGGTRIEINNVVLHPQWAPALIRYDVAVIVLSEYVTFSETIAPIALPSGDLLNEDFVDEIAVASGYGRTGDSSSGAITTLQVLSHVSLPVISNAECARAFPLNVVDSNICVSGGDRKSTCSGDSGGPLVVTRDDQPILIGIVSFGYRWGCQMNWPAAFARVTSFMDFFNENL